MSEYYKNGQNTNEAHGWYCDKTTRAAIVNCNDIPIDEIGDAENGFSWITVWKTRIYMIYACYISPNVGIREYEDWLTRLELSIRSASCDVIVAGDFNAKHRAWGSRANDNKRESLFEFANALGLMVCNQGNKPTWQRGDSESHINVTVASANLTARVTNWRVLEEYSHSDHSYIE